MDDNNEHVTPDEIIVSVETDDDYSLENLHRKVDTILLMGMEIMTFLDEGKRFMEEMQKGGLMGMIGQMFGGKH